MKLKLVTLALAFAAVPAYAAMGTTDIPTFAGQAAAKEAAKTATPKTPEEWLARMTDFTRNASAFKDPKVFVPWANAVTEPGFYIAMANGMMDPGGWLNMMNSMRPSRTPCVTWCSSPIPPSYLKWGAAGLDPNFYTALLTQLSDPGKLMRWAMVPVDPKLWNMIAQHPQPQHLHPLGHVAHGSARLEPDAGTVANPALYTGMAGAVVNPNAYGQGTNSWLTWAPAPAVQGAGSFAMWDPMAMLGNATLGEICRPCPISACPPSRPLRGPCRGACRRARRQQGDPGRRCPVPVRQVRHQGPVQGRQGQAGRRWWPS
jgi:hypothetical protein